MKTYNFFLLGAVFLASCINVKDAKHLDELPPVFPDYIGVTIPPNVAPLTFTVKDANQVVADFIYEGEVVFTAKGSGEKGVSIPMKKWRGLLSRAIGQSVQVVTFAQRKESKEWVSYQTFNLFVAKENIDPYVVYRLIKPGYELWDLMGLYQRDITSFKEKAIIENKQLASKMGLGCVNCHSFCEYSADTFMYHGRAQYSGTVVVRGNEAKRMNFKTEETGNGVYPRWHPSGKFIAYSLNDTKQAFHAYDPNKISVYDTESDLMIFDVDKDEVIVDRRFFGKSYFETFPSWSPDGKWLYFCRAAVCGDLPTNNDKMKYGIYRIAFDASTARLGDSLVCVVDERETNKSQLFPRISPDGNYLLYTECDYGTFPIWHKEAQLRMVDLRTLQPVDIDVVNSKDVDSYHSWSSNGRWVVFSSRRMDGLYTRLFIAYFGVDGKMGKPFLLPQETADFDWLRMKSYNIPEYTKNKMGKKSVAIERTQKGGETTVRLKKY